MLKTENVEKTIERKKETITFRTPSILPPIEIVKRTIKGLKKFTTSEIAEKTNLPEEDVEKILELLTIKSSEKKVWYSEDYWEKLKRTAKTILEKKPSKVSNLASALGITEEDAKKMAKEITEEKTREKLKSALDKLEEF